VLAVAVTAAVIGAGVHTAAASISTAPAPAGLVAQGSLNAGGLLPGDGAQRLVTLGATRPGSALVVTADTSSRLDTDRTDGLHLQVDACSVPWSRAGDGFTCRGALTPVVSSRPIVGRAGLPRGAGVTGSPLRFTVSLPASAGGDFLGLTSSLRYEVAT
jgi:hypothetical protein